MLSKYFIKKVRTKKFNDCIEKIFNEIKDKKVLVYGAGEGSQYLMDKYAFTNLNIVAIADKKFTKETTFKGTKAISPEDIIKEYYDFVLVTNEYTQPIINFLNKFLKIDNKKIKTIFKEFIYDERAIFMYLEKKNLQKRLDTLSNKFKNKKVVVYGAGAFFETVDEFFATEKLNIIGVSDIRFENDTNGHFRGFKKIAPTEIIKNEFDILLITLYDDETARDYFEDILFAKQKINFKIETLIKLSFWDYAKKINTF